MKEKLTEIFQRFNFEVSPVGVKFVNSTPSKMERPGRILDFCEMLKEAQEGKSFYVTKEDFSCIGPLILGMIEGEPIFEQGRVGPRLGVFKDERANRRIYQYLPRLPRNSVKYVVFSPLEKITFEPDILILLATVAQAEIILRAKSYTTGEMWNARGTVVAGCAWVYVYPYLSGEMNFTVTGFGFGMKSRRLFPEGRILITIPWDLLPKIITNLEEMEWVPESFNLGPEGHKKKVRRILEDLKKES